MPENDQFVMIQVEGMHCHRCQAAIKRDLQLIPGVHEVEVDFPSGQASVLFDPSQVQVRELMNAINESGYHAASFIQRTDPAHS